MHTAPTPNQGINGTMKRTIAIVAGGDSSEHDVSLRSAEGILSFMDAEKYNCYLVVVKTGNWNVAYNGEICLIDRNDFSFTASDGRHEFDFAYITIHGTPGENGILQGSFDRIGVKAERRKSVQTGGKDTT